MRPEARYALILAAVITVVLVAAAGATILLHPTAPEGERARLIRDMKGNQVTVPRDVHRVMTSLYPIATQLMFLVQAEDALVGISTYDMNDVMKKIYPDIVHIPVPGRSAGSDITVEEILKLQPDVVFCCTRNAQQNKALKELGISTVYLNLESPEALMRGILLVGDIMNKKERAEFVVSYYRGKLDYIQSRTSRVKNRKKVYFAGPSMLGTAGTDCYQDSLIGYAGGVNVAHALKGGWNTISVEHLLEWNPDLIFIGTYGNARVKSFANDSRLQDISAIRKKNVFMSRTYIGSWDVPTPESLLGIMWLANRLYPDDVRFNMKKEFKSFYETCYGYTPEEQDILSVLEKQ